MNDEYSANLLNRFNGNLKKNQPDLAKNNALFHQDNVTGAHALIRYAEIQRTGLVVAPSSAMFSGFSPQ